MLITYWSQVQILHLVPIRLKEIKMDCIIIGDSIAVGTSSVRRECSSFSVVGINSSNWNKKFSTLDVSARSVIISLGTNDFNHVITLKELTALRSRINADKVFWILPPCNSSFCKPEINNVVKSLADSYGDWVIRTNKLSKDNIHPSRAGYQEIAEITR